MNLTQPKLRFSQALRSRVVCWGALLGMAGCDLNSPVDATFDFIANFGAAKIESRTQVGYMFYENFSQGRITPLTTPAITPNGKPVFPLAAAEIGGEKRKAIVMIAPSEIAFEGIVVERNAWLEFRVGQMFSDGDGAEAFVIIDAMGRRDTLYRRSFNTKQNESDRHWMHETLGLAEYFDKSVKIIFASGTGGKGDDLGDFIAWESPILFESGTETTPTGYGTYAARHWEIGGEKRDAIITLAGSAAVFALPGNREGEVLYFGAGMKFLLGDGAEGFILCEVEGRRDTLYRRFLNPNNRPDHRQWFNEVLYLSRYRGKDIKLIFTAGPGPVGELTADWFAWGTPVLSLPRR